MKDSKLEVKPWLKELSPYPPGKSLAEVRRELGLKGPIYKLASNENPLGPSPMALTAIRERLSEIHRYPEASGRDLSEALAKRFGVKPEMVVLGNGSNEVIDLLIRALVSPGEEIILSAPTFLMYEKFGAAAGAKFSRIPLKEFKHDLSAILEAVNERTRIIFLDHPHNPTGSVLEREPFEDFLAKLPSSILVVIDEAYGEFVRDEKAISGIEYLKKGYPVAVLRTFSKAYGLAGLRVGYGLMSETLSRILNAMRQPFNVNILAQVAALAALEDEEHLEKTLKLTWEGLDYFYQELPRLGLRPLPSQANFLLVDCQRSARPIYEVLLRRGIIVRPMEAYGFPNYLRISIGLPHENEALVAALEDIL
ncbi:histidinol-phosphate transaminase [Thermosulfurimonas dismutans]|uniref:Histidinol-phosphate aminotransferase n=1 Tax=Thermosulfurimonas dismutans TaxID=999894 RepID=A0A179D2A5_9BACT|nr:histidinol-phosphate transaminase [Thermosulfurimonas dismutans]OAQ19941.1 Biosynthetic Aromatic amino acid aminotransferase beta [Thermosulfurimonas dismutans]